MVKVILMILDGLVGIVLVFVKCIFRIMDLKTHSIYGIYCLEFLVD